MSKNIKSSLFLTNDIAVLPVCLAFVESFAKLYADPKRIDYILLAAEEAFCHTVENAYEPEETGEIHITAESDHSGFKLIFNDMGLPFDMSTLDRYDPVNPDPDMNSVGLFILQKIPDQVKWEHMGMQGNMLTISFENEYLNIAEIDGIGEKAEDNEQQVQDYSYDIRFAIPEDAIHISRCIYRTYGYTYLSEDPYYPEKISKRIADKSLISVIAVCENGETVGHCSLIIRVPNILAESGQAVVSPAHRGHGLLEKMKELLDDYAIKTGLTGICSEPVTNHTRSQQTSLKTGSRSCGLMLGYIPTSFHFKAMDKGENTMRRSCVYNYKPLLKPRSKSIYIASAYSDLVSRIYEGCDMDIRIVTDETLDESRTTQLYSSFIQGQQIGVIVVESIGADCYQQVKQGLFYLTMRTSAEMVYLNLPLEDQNCAYLTRKARELGFVFCAVVMGMDGGRDMLRLQFINCDIDYDGIKLTGDTAESIYDFIRKEIDGIDGS